MYHVHQLHSISLLELQPSLIAMFRKSSEHRLETLLSLEGQRVSAVTIQTRRVGP